VSGAFHDQDMLALVEVLLKHANGTLNFIHRLDFTLAGKVGKNHRKYGFTSHGSLALAKLLQTSKNIREVLLPKHKIGPYGATAIFMACAQNGSIQQLGMRGCRIGNKGGFGFAELIPSSSSTGLLEVDLSANRIGPEATTAIEKGLEQRFKNENMVPIAVNLEGNHVFPQVMNGVTHGLGVVLSFIGGYMLSRRISGLSKIHDISCAVYTTSLLALYMSSTLYHSFFSLQSTKYVFEVFDKCAIYILIAGSYTPFLQIILSDNPIWSVGLLAFIWICCLFGICVEAFLPTWEYRGVFSLSMYLGMGWACLICLPEMMERLPQSCLNLLVLGGVAYTVGVPFFVRNNNLDHAIWHLFVLSGSIFHWLAVYLYVAPLPLPQ
jgi:hemolysin III